MTALLALLFACAPPVPEAPAPVQSGSLYALDLDLVDSSGGIVSLAAARGHPVLFSMFYTSCPMACPLLVQEIQSIEAEVPEALRGELRVMLVSMDPAHDDAAALRAAAEKHGLDARWILAATPDVRVVAAALGVRYRPLPEGGFAHTAVLTLADEEGRVVGRSEGTAGRDELVRALLRLLGEQ